MNFLQTHNALTTQKSVAVYFKFVKTEETFSSQDQKLVEITICDNCIETKIFQRNFTSLMTPTRVELNKWKTWAHQNDNISQTLWSKLAKLVRRKTASLIDT